jgi:PAS domain S-box-containing protein
MIEAKLRTALLADRRLQALMDDPRPAFVWHLDGRSLVWANRAGAQSLNLSPSEIARQHSNAALVSLAPQIAAVARKLPRPGAMRLERLRLPGMGALDALSCACRSFDGPEGFLGLMVQSLDLPRRGRRQQGWAPPSVAETLPPLSPADDGGLAGPYEQSGAWSWVDLDGEKPAPEATPVVPEARRIEPSPPAAAPVARKKPVRFTFQTDASGRFVAVSRELAQVLGSAGADWTGRRFDEIAVASGFEGGADIAAAFASRQTWTGLSLSWPDAVGRQEIPIILSASPVLGGEGRFQGFRGFGVAGVPKPLTAVPQPATQPSSQPAPSIVWQEADPAEDDEADLAPVPPPQPAPTSPPPETTRPARPTVESNVVRLPSKPGAERIAQERVGHDRHSLTPTERLAFHEIAKALGARIEGEPRPSVPNDDAQAQSAKPEVEGLERLKIERLRPQTRVEEPFLPLGVADDKADALEPSPAEPVPSQPVKLGRLDKVPVALIDRLPIGIVIARGEELQFANRTMLELLGYADIEAIRRAGGLDHVFAGAAPIANGEEASSGVLLKTVSGETITVDGKVQTTHWEGESALLISVRRPLGEASAEKLRFAERRADELQAVLDTATDGVVILDREGRIVSINRSAEALFGYEQREIVGKDLLLLFAPESHRAAYDYLDSLRSNGVASLLNDGREVMGRVRQGGSVPLFMTIGRLGDDGKRLCAVLRDVTSFKKAEGELTAAKRQAEEASSQKSDFLAKISHEVRTPLNAIIGFAEVMMEERFGPMGNERYRSYARDIHTSGEHVISLVNDLLDLSKIEAGKLDLTFASVSLNEVVQQSVSLMQPQASRDRIIIRMALANGLPNVVADNRSMRQIVLNLLSNSIKFTQAGGQAIISTTLSERGEAVLRVRDTGVGMTERELAIAMEPFRQVASTTLGGTGLGLPLTKALVEANRASFAIQSTKNAGTLVEVVFPSTRVLAE